MTLSPQRLEKAAEAMADALSFAWHDPKVRKQLRKDAARIISTYLGDTHVEISCVAKSYASQMSNLCFNLKQSNKVSAEIKRQMDSVQTGWDKATSAELTEKDVG